MSDNDEDIPTERGGNKVVCSRSLLQLVGWIGFGLLALALLVWALTYLRPDVAALSSQNPSAVQSTPTALVSPIAIVDQANEIPIEPLLQSDSVGQGLWSPDGEYFFIPLGDLTAPGGDRYNISLHFISASSGEDCPASETFLGQHGYQNYTWLDNERVLYIDNRGQAFLFTACEPGSQGLSDHFNEPLVRVAMPLAPTDPPMQGPLLLETASAYWLLDPITLQARALSDPIPSPELTDNFAWLASEHLMAIMQPITEKPELSRLVLLNLDSGEVLRSLEIQSSHEWGAPSSEWLGTQRLFIWSMDQIGPILLDLSQEPPQQVRVFAELYGIDMLYPEQLSSMGVFYAPDGDKYHIVFKAEFPDDRSIYLYHSESGQVEKLDGDRQAMMIFPDDQRMSLVSMPDGPVEDGSYDVLWVDEPNRPQVHVEASGHLPRNYYLLQSHLLPGGTRMLFGSSQGISLVDLTDGKTLAFWRLTGAEGSWLPHLYLSPDGRVLIATTESLESVPQGSGLYRLVLEE
jgi:hypothetical protein